MLVLEKFSFIRYIKLAIIMSYASYNNQFMSCIYKVITWLNVYGLTLFGTFDHRSQRTNGIISILNQHINIQTLF